MTGEYVKVYNSLSGSTESRYKCSAPEIIKRPPNQVPGTSSAKEASGLVESHCFWVFPGLPQRCRLAQLALQIGWVENIAWNYAWNRWLRALYRGRFASRSLIRTLVLARNLSGWQLSGSFQYVSYLTS